MSDAPKWGYICSTSFECELGQCPQTVIFNSLEVLLEECLCCTAEGSHCKALKVMIVEALEVEHFGTKDHQQE